MNPVFKNLSKHSKNNRESLEGKILSLIREYRKLSQLEVAQALGLKKAEIDHLENGRKFYNNNDIEMFLNLYEVSMNDFNEMKTFKTFNKSITDNYLLPKYPNKTK